MIHLSMSVLFKKSRFLILFSFNPCHVDGLGTSFGHQPLADRAALSLYFLTILTVTFCHGVDSSGRVIYSSS